MPRLLPILQLVRAPLVFTALADGLAAMLLRGGVPFRALLAAQVASACLYFYGMSLNDLVDFHRDSSAAPGRPLPAGRISVVAARAVVTVLGGGALAAGSAYAAMVDSWLALALLLATFATISFYNFVGKYLVSVGILSLGLARGLHAAFAMGGLSAVPQHPLALTLYVSVASTFGYLIEGKRPRISGIHLAILIAFLAGLIVGLLKSWHHPAAALASGTIALCVLAALAYAAKPALFGRTFMLYALLGLILLDAAFTLAYLGPTPALIVAANLPLAYAGVLAMRRASAPRG